MDKIAGMLKDVAYQSNTQEFWNSCAAICDESDYRLNGAFNDGKGQPSQSNAVSHGSATSRFNGVNVINTGRTIIIQFIKQNTLNLKNFKSSEHGYIFKRRSKKNTGESCWVLQSRRLRSKP